MKLATLSTTFLACALTLVSAAALPETAQNPDGAYASYLDESGNEIVQFIPWEQIGNSSFVPISSVIPATNVKRDSTAVVEKRAKEGCHKSATRDPWRIDEANQCMYDSQADPFVFLGGGNRRRSCVRSGVRSFICSYAAAGEEHITAKYKFDLRQTWAWIRNVKCSGWGRLGHAEISGGYGLVSAGYTYDGDSFCW
ncbi:hypothetical protein V8F06_009910 [Rhypophila decipiens]